MATLFEDQPAPRSALRIEEPIYTDRASQVRNRFDPTSDFARGFASTASQLRAAESANLAQEAELAGDTVARDKHLVDMRLQQSEAAAMAPRVSRLQDIHGIGDAVDFAQQGVASFIPTALPSIAAAVLTRGRGAGLASKLVPYAAATVPAYQMERNEAIADQYNDPRLAALPVEERADTAMAKGGINSLLEAVIPGRIGSSLLRRPVAGIIDNAITEGITEVAQEGVGYGARRYLDPEQTLDPMDLANAGVLGAIGGGGLSIATNPVGSLSGAVTEPIRQRAEALGSRARDALGARMRRPQTDEQPPGGPIDLEEPEQQASGGAREFFDEEIRPRAGKAYDSTKDFVSTTIDRMGEAAKTAQSPSDFLRQVFGSSVEDAAAADLRPDTEDPGVMSAADPAAALQQRDAQRQERAAAFAEELLNDPATPDTVKERVASFGGDFSDPEARAFVARTLVAQRAGEKLVNAVSDLIDLSKDFGGKAAEVGTDLAAKARGMIDKGMSAAADRIVKKNLQDATPAEQATFNKLIFDNLTDEAKASPAVRQRLPELANAMLAFAARTGDLTKADLKTLSRMQDGLAMFRDPEQLAAKLTEYAGLPRTEDSFLSRVKRVTNAQQDILQPNSFLYSSLSEDAKDSLIQPQLRRLARLVDDFTLSDSSKAQGDKVLAGLTAAFGSKEAAQSVLDYYQQQNRADLRFEPTRPTGDAYEGTDDIAEFGTLPERDAPVQDTYYADAKSMRPFYEGREGRLSTEGGTRRRVRDIEAFMDRMQGRGTELRAQRYGDFLKERDEDSAEAVKRIRKDLEKRIAEAAPRKGEAAEYAEGRKKNRQYLEEQLLALNLIDKADGPEAAANLFSVARAVGERSELGITDAQLAESDTLLRRTLNPKKPPSGLSQRQAEKHNRDIAKTKLVFNRTNGAQPLVLSAESLWKAYAKGQPAGRSMRQLFADAVSAVLNRPDIEDLAHGLDGVLIDRASGTYAEPQVSDDVREAKKALAHKYEARLNEAESRVKAAASEIEDARDEGPADSALVERIEATADELQREADAGRITATALKDEAKEKKWEDGAPSPEAIKLRARAAWEHDISRVFAEGARDLRETATEVRSELDRVKNDSNDAYFGNEFRRLERRRNDLQHAYDVAHDSGNEAAIKDAKRRLDAVEGAIKRMEAREAAERAYGSAGRTASEERGGAAKVRNYDESTGAALHPDDKPSAAKPEGLGKRLDAALLANPELLEVLDARGEPKDKALTESRMRERLFEAYSAIKTPALKARIEGLRAKYQEAENASNVGTPAAREAAKQEAAALKEIGQMVRWVLERREGGRAGDAPKPKIELPPVNEGVADALRPVLGKYAEEGSRAAQLDDASYAAWRTQAVRDMTDGKDAEKNYMLVAMLDRFVKLYDADGGREDINKAKRSKFWAKSTEGRVHAALDAIGAEEEVKAKAEPKAEAKAEPKPKTMSDAAVAALHDIAVKENFSRLDTPEKVLRYAAMARAALDQLGQIPEDARTEMQDELLTKLRADFDQSGNSAFDWDMMFDGMKPTAEQRALLEDIVAKKSAMGAKKGRPGKIDTQKIIDEIRRIRGDKVKVIFQKFSEIGGSGEFSMNKDKTDRLIKIAVNASNPMGTAWHESLHDFFAMLGEDRTGRSIKKDLIDAAEAPQVKRQLRELLAKHPEALKQIDESPEERVAYMYQFWAEGLLRLGPTGTGIFERVRQLFHDLFGLVSADSRAEELLTALHEGKFAEPSTVAEVLADMSGDRFSNKMEKAAPALTDALGKVFSTAPDRLRAYQNDTLTELADMFSSERGKLGFIQKRFQQQGVWENKLAGVLAGTTAQERRAALENLQAMKPPSSKLEKELASFFSEMHGYMTEAGVKTLDSKTKKWVPLREVKGYFPRMFDRHALLADRAGFISLLQKHGNMDLKQANAAFDALTHGTGQLELAENEHALGFTPYAQAVQDRRFTFINPSNASEFAKYQVKDLADITTGYVKQAVHRAEYARMFGNDGEVITKMISESGIKDRKELEDIGKVVQGLEGSLGNGMSTATKELMSGVMTLQNVVVLPLAIFSQMIDPVVLAARSGELKDAGTAYMTAIKRLVGKEVDGEELANMLGIISQDSVLEAMGAAYGTAHMSKRMRDINRVFFKYNGMQGWNNSMRIAATAAGERYLIANKSNDKALAELGLTSKDVKVKKDGRLDVSSPKVQQAMYRFVDQAVLRPSASNRPVWMSDPRFLLVAHLKQFTYAMHNVVLKRASRELADGNPKPWGILMLTLPAILAADMAKFALTGTGPNTWGFKDYLVHAVERSGLLGLGDFGVQATRGVDMGKMPGEGLLGPTFENLMEILRWIGGDPRTGLGDVIDRTVPGTRFI